MDNTVTITLTAKEAAWLIDQLADWWEVGYCGLEELDYWLPLITTYKTLEDAGVKRTRNVGGME